ncbi:MAG: DUF3108 domain-containing protein [Bacteroidales bacterium]|jgi:hypothetical protein|nr:DUF3108 domain-containing protein [Bacteroidales bacterium]
MFKLKTYTFIIILVFANAITVNSQSIVNQFPVFNAGEKVTYDASYNWGFIWINAGNAEFNVKDTIYRGVDSYHFNVYGSSIPSYDWLFKVRDHFQSFAQKKDLAPLFFDRNTLEGGDYVMNRFTFDYEDSLIYSQTENSDKSYSEDTLKLIQKLYDVISGVYYVRNIDFDKYEINDTIPIRMIIDNEIFELYIRYLGKEILKTHNKQIFNTIKFSALLIEGTIFRGGEDLYVWVSDDLNRIPILVEAKILIGSVKATLRSTENLKFPLSSEIKLYKN